MKRLFIILAAVCMAVSGMAGVTIPQNIYGLRLGKSTKQEVHQILTAKGLELYRDETDSLDYVYRGTCMHEGMEFQGIVTRYMGDTLFYVGFAAKCDSLCDDFGKAFLQRIHSKYDQLQPGDSSLYYPALTTGFDSAGLYRWGRKDNNTLIVTLHNDTTCMCWYFADSFVYSYMFNQFLEYYKAEDPNYSEENKVTGIAGVKFGDSRIKTIDAFKQRGTFLKSEGKLSYFTDLSFGGQTYSVVTLHFKYDPKRNDMTLSAAKFEKNFYEWNKEEAEMTYDAIVSTYQKKYTNCTILRDEDGEKAMACGMLQDDYAEGKMPPIMITLDLGISRGGDKYYYVTVTYFGMNISDSATEDI